ncbi:reverse transcriptase [Trichonephila clavipes]|nr:reverse transcriptase [Trichonephila clavipes]
MPWWQIDTSGRLKSVPSRVGISDNERADQKPKEGAESSQPEVPLTLKKANSLISTCVCKYTTGTQSTKILWKPWEILSIVGPIQRHLERSEAVARFRLTTRHDFLGVYLHWLCLAVDEACPLCGRARIDSDHLLLCSELVEYMTHDIVSRYWEAPCQRAKKPSKGVG